MNRGYDFTKSNNEAAARPKTKIIVINLFIILTVMLVVQGCNITNKNTNNSNTAIKKVSDLFEVEDEDDENITEGNPGKIKDSTDQEQINEAIEAIDKVDTSAGTQDENTAIVFGLQSAALVAQVQLNEREGTEVSVDNDSQEEQKEQFQPDEDDVVWKHNKLKNKDLFEEFVNVAGENNDSHIRVVKDEGEKGVLIYDLESRYDKNADQGWIKVTPDLTHYIASENDVQDVFNVSQQCGYISKDEQEGYYNFNECRTHLEYQFLPIVNDN